MHDETEMSMMVDAWALSREFGYENTLDYKTVEKQLLCIIYGLKWFDQIMLP